MPSPSYHQYVATYRQIFYWFISFFFFRSVFELRCVQKYKKILERKTSCLLLHRMAFKKTDGRVDPDHAWLENWRWPPTVMIDIIVLIWCEVSMKAICSPSSYIRYLQKVTNCHGNFNQVNQVRRQNGFLETGTREDSFSCETSYLI